MIKNQMYREVYGHLIELGIRLQCKSETICTAIIYFYRLSEKSDYIKGYDKYNVARACFCAAGNREGDTHFTGAEDVLNVSNKILYPESHPVLIVDERAAGRMKEFDEIRKRLNSRCWSNTGAPQTHKNLARYLSLLRDYQPRLFEQYEMEKLCTIVLQVINFLLHIRTMLFCRICTFVHILFGNLVVKLLQHWQFILFSNMLHLKLQRMNLLIMYAQMLVDLI
jgi:hypothetical protein